MTPMKLVAAVSAYEKQLCAAKLAGEMRKEFERSLVCPVQILDHDDDRPVAGQVGEKVGKERMEPISVDTSRCLIDRSNRERRQTVRRAGDVHEGTERATCIDLRALAGESTNTKAASRLNEITDRRALAHTGLAGYKDRAAVTPASLGQQRVELTHFGVAADEERTKDLRICRRPCCRGHGTLPPRRILSCAIRPTRRRARHLREKATSATHVVQRGPRSSRSADGSLTGVAGIASGLLQYGLSGSRITRVRLAPGTAPSDVWIPVQYGLS